MSATTDLMAKISGTAGVSALVGSRIFHRMVPHATAYPYIVVGRDSMEIEDHISGATNMRRAEYSIAIVGDRLSELEPIENAVITAINKFRGTMGTTPVKECSFIASSNSDLSPADGSEDNITIITSRYELFYTE